jgi:hypothetical protein
MGDLGADGFIILRHLIEIKCENVSRIGLIKDRIP